MTKTTHVRPHNNSDKLRYRWFASTAVRWKRRYPVVYILRLHLFLRTACFVNVYCICDIIHRSNRLGVWATQIHNHIRGEVFCYSAECQCDRYFDAFRQVVAQPPNDISLYESLYTWYSLKETWHVKYMWLLICIAYYQGDPHCHGLRSINDIHLIYWKDGIFVLKRFQL